MGIVKVKINVHSGELEFEGSEEFVKQQMDNLESIVDIIAQLRLDNSEISDRYMILDDEQKGEENQNLKVDDKNTLSVPTFFGEWLHQFKDDLTDADKALLAAYFIQVNSEENQFKTGEVNETLKEHGIKLSNTSRTLEWLSDKKLIFQIKKSGKLKLFRVSIDGINQLKSLLR
jgi:hypothetical protein